LRGLQVTEISVGVYGVQTAKRMRCRRRERCKLTDNLVKTGKWSDGEQRVVETDGMRDVSDDEMTRSRV